MRYVSYIDVFAVCAECHPSARCVSVGRLQYDCQCLRGFRGDGRNCVGKNTTYYRIAGNIGSLIFGGRALN